MARITSRFTIFVLMLSINALAGDRSRNKSDIEILASVFESEMSANGWQSTDLICISVDGKDPNRRLLSALRQRKLNVCSQAEWRRKLSCGFGVFFSSPVDSDPGGAVLVRFQSVDFRRVNTGEEHFAGVLRHGEYTLKKVDGQWTIVRYAPGQ